MNFIVNRYENAKWQLTVCVCVLKTMKRKAKAKRKPLANCLCLSPSPLSLPLSLSLFVVSKIAIVIWGKISITASMPCHKRNPIPIPIPETQAATQAGVHCGQAWRVTLPSSPPYTSLSLLFVIESNHLWLPNASEIMKRKPLCGASAAGGVAWPTILWKPQN